ncbi:hypothetical protein C1645_736168 [Glomus cerebriforme]|uniref:Uncharacterized protein n=1 Tax=Glomus cerebriforme TaxID=658196 RepID=A0A397TCQ9_9GLOM|nr:hypothetical protein C1645_736168 [Glomus cerebriforme]
MDLRGKCEKYRDKASEIEHICDLLMLRESFYRLQTWMIIIESRYISVRELKALKVLNMEKEVPLDHIQEEIEQNLSILKYKLEVNSAFITSIFCSEQSERMYVADVIIPLFQASLSGLSNSNICLSMAEYQSLASKTQQNLRINEKRMGKKPDVLKQDEKIKLIYTESSCIIYSKSKKWMMM